MPLLNCTTPIWAENRAGNVTIKSSSNDSDKVQGTRNRRVVCDVGMVYGASGSSFIELGGVIVLCSVNGPHTTQRSVVEGPGVLECTVHYAPFANKPNSGILVSSDQMSSAGGNQMTPFEKSLSQLLREALVGSVKLELYQKMIISLSVLIVQSSGNTGSDLAASITAGSLALVDASIETLDFVTASTVGIVSSGDSKLPNSCILDPPESSRVIGSLTVAALTSLNEISQLFCEGRVDTESIPFLMVKVKHAAEELRGDLSNCIESHKL